MSLKRSHWLTLGEAAEFLGVHPTTIRRWANDGAIQCHRTPGGHRRFQEKDLQAFLSSMEQSSSDLVPGIFLQDLVRLTRHEMEQQEITTESWYLAFDENSRTAYRESGRRLLGLALQYTLRSTGREPIVAEGRRIGWQYGQIATESGLPLVAIVRAFLFFRETLIRTARPGLHRQGRYDDEDVHIHRSMRKFLDEVLFAILESYEQSRGGYLAPRGTG